MRKGTLVPKLKTKSTTTTQTRSRSKAMSNEDQESDEHLVPSKYQHADTTSQALPMTSAPKYQSLPPMKDTTYQLWVRIAQILLFRSWVMLLRLVSQNSQSSPPSCGSRFVSIICVKSSSVRKIYTHPQGNRSHSLFQALLNTQLIIYHPLGSPTYLVPETSKSTSSAPGKPPTSAPQNGLTSTSSSSDQPAKKFTSKSRRNTASSHLPTWE